MSYVKNKFFNIRGKTILVVRLGETMGDTCWESSPIKTVVELLENEHANITHFDVFMEWCDTLPALHNENGMDNFDIILVFHPYFMS